MGNNLETTTVGEEVLSSKGSDSFFDFRKAKVQTLTIEQLERTQKEHDIYDNPLKGIYHFELLRSIERLANEANLHIEYDEIFAANGGPKEASGVVLLPKEEAKYGERAIEAHVLRRVYSNMIIRDKDTDELTTQLSVAFHQNGIQVGIGNQVKICHNLTMLSAQNTCSTFGKEKLSVPDLLETIKGWLFNYDHIIETDREKINRMKEIEVTAEQNFMLIGMLTCARIAKDTSNKKIHITDQYPLNQSQITKFAEMNMISYADNGNVTLWDWYNNATELYKAGKTEIPNIMPQALAMNGFIDKMFF